MPTTGVNFININAATLQGSAVNTAVDTAQYCDTCSPDVAAQLSADRAAGTIVDRVAVDLGQAAEPKYGQSIPVGGLYVCAFPRNGCVLLATSGTTAVTIDLTALAVATGVSSVAGDADFSGKLKAIVLRNLNPTSGDFAVAPGASNGFPMNLAGTTPSVKVESGSAVVIHSKAGITVDATHKTITVTPTAGGVLAISLGGSAS